MSEEFQAGLLAQDENSISDIRRAFAEGSEPFKPNEFTEFWQSLNDEEKKEFKHMDLSTI